MSETQSSSAIKCTVRVLSSHMQRQIIVNFLKFILSASSSKWTVMTSNKNKKNSNTAIDSQMYSMYYELLTRN